MSTTYTNHVEGMRVGELADIVRRSLCTRVPDLNEAEVGAFVSGLVTSVGLAAVARAFEARRAGNAPRVERFRSGTGRFDFSELPRTQLVGELDASTGLGLDACDAGLSAIEAEVAERTRAGDAVQLERIGIFRPVAGDEMELELDPDLKVAPAPSAAAYAAL